MEFTKKFIIAFFAYFYFSQFAVGMENAFYILRSNAPSTISQVQDSITSLKAHYQSINLLIPQAYQVEENGLVWGSVDPEVLSFAQKNSIKLMPLVTNAGFNKEKVHKFLSNPVAQQKAVNSILEACNQYHYYGVQLDFEVVSLEDRDALTHFFSQVVQALHKQKFVVSYSVAPTVESELFGSDFLKKLYENSEGAYDLKAINQMGDFVSIMAYNQHAGITTPGPTASFPWVEAAIKHALKYLPAEKISLGIPVYSTYWYTGKEPSGKLGMLMTDIGYRKVEYLLNKHHAKLIWDENEKINYTIYEHEWLNEYIFVEDEKSFRAKKELAKKYKLRGISVFDIGIEDPKIWELLK